MIFILAVGASRTSLTVDPGGTRGKDVGCTYDEATPTSQRGTVSKVKAISRVEGPVIKSEPVHEVQAAPTRLSSAMSPLFLASTKGSTSESVGKMPVSDSKKVGAMTTRRETVVGRTSLTVGPGGTRGQEVGCTDGNNLFDNVIDPHLLELKEKKLSVRVYLIIKDIVLPSQATACSPKEDLHYSVKIINQSRKSKYEMHRLCVKKKFETIAELKEELVKAFCDKIGNSPPEQVGYFEPGHGAKGSYALDFQNYDLAHQTSKHARCAEDSTDDITSGAPSTKVTCSEAISEKLKEVDEIVKQLSGIHEATGNYTMEQLRTWAHLIQMKKHTSMDIPPDKPFFGQSSKRKLSHTSTNSTFRLKVISMRGDCID
uniref:Uncharacterized protein n=1 Tax=Amphimedon queenslandica TaxID=400682 RepID=A0A1X7UBP1_AMPQE